MVSAPAAAAARRAVQAASRALSASPRCEEALSFTSPDPAGLPAGCAACRSPGPPAGAGSLPLASSGVVPAGPSASSSPPSPRARSGSSAHGGVNTPPCHNARPATASATTALRPSKATRGAERRRRRPRPGSRGGRSTTTRSPPGPPSASSMCAIVGKRSSGSLRIARSIAWRRSAGTSGRTLSRGSGYSWRCL